MLIIRRDIKHILLFVLSLMSFNAQANELSINQSYQLAYLLPAPEKLTLIEARNSAEWQTSKDGWIKENFLQSNFWVGETPKVAWLKLDFNPEVINVNELWLELASSGVTRATIYQKHEGTWRQYNSDDNQKNLVQNNTHSSYDAKVSSRFISFLINVQDDTDSIYLRVEASDKFHLQLNVKTNQNFIIDSSISNFIYAMGYGILLVMVFYNLFIGFTLNDSLYYIYSGAIFSTLVYQFFAHGHARLFAHFNWDHVNYSLNFLVFLIATLSMYFLYYFCNLKKYTPEIAKPLRVFLKVMILLTASSLFIPTNISLNIILTVVGSTPLLALLIAIYAWFKGSPTASIFIISWLAYIVGGFLWQGYWLGLVTLTDWVEIPLIAGASVESILLSLALAYRIRVLNEQTAELQVSNAHYKRISQIDPLSKLANRREFDTRMSELDSIESEFGLILFDIDNFKAFNDRYGHPAGDKVIIAMADILKHNMRGNDLAARIGGEEFAVILAVGNNDILHNVADRIRIQFSDMPIIIDDEEIHCTTSAGFASSAKNETTTSLINRADNALYKAKDNGRNRVESS